MDSRDHRRSAEEPFKEALMIRIISFLFKITLAISLFGCASSSHQFFDSSMNDKNRAPASLGIPDSFNQDVTAIDPMHNQAEADFLFLKSEMESSAGRNSEAIELLRSALIYDPESATLMQRLAIEYYKSAKINDAMYWAEKAKALSPDRRDLSLLVAGLYTTTRNYTKAEELYKHLIKKDDEDTEAMLYLGAVYTEQKNYPKAIGIFKNLSQDSTYASGYLAHYYLARVYSEQSKANIKKIKDELKKSVSLRPDFFEAVNMLGHLIEKEEGAGKAIAFYADHQRKYGPNLKLAEMLSQYYIGRNEFDKAYEQLEILDESNEDMIQVKLKMALILIEKKIYDKAIVKLKEILKTTPESDKVRFYLAAVLEEKREFNNAFEHYIKIEKNSGYYEESRLHAALLAKLMGDSDKAISVLRESIDKKVENPQSYFLMSQLFEDKKDFKSALDTLKSAEIKFPKNSQVYYYLGALQDKMNLKDDMMKNMKKVIELEPEHAQALNYLAYTWAENGHELEMAEIYARKAAEKENDDAFILDTLGWVLYKKGKFRDAVEVLEKAHAMQPQASIISEHLGDIYTKLNLHNKARALFIKAVEAEVDLVRKEEIKSKLSQIEDSLKNLRVPSSVDSGLNAGEPQQP